MRQEGVKTVLEIEKGEEKPVQLCFELQRSGLDLVSLRRIDIRLANKRNSML